MCANRVHRVNLCLAELAASRGSYAVQRIFVSAHVYVCVRAPELHFHLLLINDSDRVRADVSRHFYAPVDVSYVYYIRFSD